MRAHKKTMCRLATCTKAADADAGELFCDARRKLRIPSFLVATAEKNKPAFERIVAIVAERIPHKLITR